MRRTSWIVYKGAGLVISLAVIKGSFNNETFLRAGLVQFCLGITGAWCNLDQLRQSTTITTPQIANLQTLRDFSTANLAAVDPGDGLGFAHFNHAAEAWGRRVDLARRQADLQHSACR